ncbi:MAG: hypothetical protein OXC31_00040 [Spirochaetaceae bacterium]|nr:hypothetical protein [Spirochaetaceae bacterium]
MAVSSWATAAASVRLTVDSLIPNAVTLRGLPPTVTRNAAPDSLVSCSSTSSKVSVSVSPTITASRSVGAALSTAVSTAFHVDIPWVAECTRTKCRLFLESGPVSRPNVSMRAPMKPVVCAIPGPSTHSWNACRWLGWPSFSRTVTESAVAVSVKSSCVMPVRGIAFVSRTHGAPTFVGGPAATTIPAYCAGTVVAVDTVTSINGMDGSSRVRLTTPLTEAPFATVLVPEAGVPPTTENAAVIGNGAPSRTRTRNECVLTGSTAAASVKGLPGLSSRSSDVSACRSVKRAAGSDVRALFERSSEVSARRSVKRAAGSDVSALFERSSEVSARRMSKSSALSVTRS